MSGRPIPPNRRWQRENRSRRPPPPDEAHLDRLEELLRRMLQEDPRFQALLAEHLREAMAIYRAELHERLRQELPRRRPPRQLSIIQRILLGIFQIAIILTLAWGIGKIVERISPQQEPTETARQAGDLVSFEKYRQAMEAARRKEAEQQETVELSPAADPSEEAGDSSSDSDDLLSESDDSSPERNDLPSESDDLLSGDNDLRGGSDPGEER